MPWIRDIISCLSLEFLLIAPLCLVAAVGIFLLLFRHRRSAVWAWLFILSLSCGMIALHEKGGGSFAFGYGCLLFAVILLFAPGLLLRRGERPARKKRHKQTAESRGKIDADLSARSPVLSGMPIPDAVLPQEEKPVPKGADVNTDIQLEHVFQVLKKLQGMKLSAGDRLETDVIHNMLTVYRAKGALSADETRALNNYLATLLKLMSKYSV